MWVRFGDLKIFGRIGIDTEGVKEAGEEERVGRRRVGRRRKGRENKKERSDLERVLSPYLSSSPDPSFSHLFHSLCLDSIPPEKSSHPPKSDLQSPIREDHWKREIDISTVESHYNAPASNRNPPITEIILGFL